MAEDAPLRRRVSPNAPRPACTPQPPPYLPAPEGLPAMPPASHTPTSTMDLPMSHLVLASIIQVTAAMRKNSRWANASAYTSAAHSSHHSRTSLLDRSANEYGPPGSDRARVLGQEELMAGFVELRRRVQESEGACRRVSPCGFLLFQPMSRRSSVSLAEVSISILHLLLSSPGPCHDRPAPAGDPRRAIPLPHPVALDYGPHHFARSHRPPFAAPNLPSRLLNR